nr:hypothetical protein Iba_chr05aCG13070 [Ipomoea batatas]GMD01901.1 hypothetical protein Iba_chr05fCG11500 [Ipomoea batatas]
MQVLNLKLRCPTVDVQRSTIHAQPLRRRFLSPLCLSSTPYGQSRRPTVSTPSSDHCESPTSVAEPGFFNFNDSQRSIEGFQLATLAVPAQSRGPKAGRAGWPPLGLYY